MKKNLIIPLTFFFCIGCAKQGSAQMTSQESAKKEIREAVNVIFQSLEKMDAEALFQSYANSPDFIFLTTDGSRADYQAARNHHAAWFMGLSSLIVTTAKDEFRFLPGSFVICAWQGQFAMTLKTGEQFKIDPFGITFVFSRIGNHWLVIYQHSSALPPFRYSPRSSHRPVNSFSVFASRARNATSARQNGQPV